MRVDAFHNWRRELEEVEQEMNSLMAQGLPASSQERQVRRTRFAALIERREAAARNLLKSDFVPRRSKSPTRAPSPGDHVIAAAQAPAAPEGQAEAFVPLPEGTRKPEARLERLADRSADLADIWKPDLGAAAVPPNFAAAAADRAPPAEPPKTPDSSIPDSSVLDSSVRDSSVPDSAVLADPGSLPADVAAAAPDADSLVADTAAPAATAAVPAKPAELPAAVLALVAEAAALASESDAVPPAGASDPAPAPATDVVSAAVASIAAAIASVSDPAVPAAADSEAAEPETNVVVFVPDASVPAESAAESAAPSDLSVDDFIANHSSGAVASPGDAVVADAETPPAPAPDDLQPEALLRKLLRRLQLGSSPKRT
jgi:hypothetical protein